MDSTADFGDPDPISKTNRSESPHSHSGGRVFTFSVSNCFYVGDRRADTSIDIMVIRNFRGRDSRFDRLSLE
ncbi:MAG: hypothetical protein E5W94_03415 [Mesorhizobium sp.]|nr:MAG: hypothetical protein E5W94_03415 [Mesorhizobium sp.]